MDTSSEFADPYPTLGPLLPLPLSSPAASTPMFTKRFDSAIEVFIFRSVYLSTYIQLTIHISATRRISHINFLRTFSSYFKIIVHKYFSKFMEFFRDLCLLYTVMSKLLLFPYRGTTFRQKIYLCPGGALILVQYWSVLFS